MVRVALRSSRRLFRDAVAGCLEARPEFTVVGSVTDLDDLLALCRLRAPDVVVVDLDTGMGTEEEALTRLQACAGLTRLVMVYERLTSAELGELWRLGVDTLMPCSHGLDALFVVLQQYLTSYRDRPARSTSAEDGLTRQEGEIISLLSAGNTTNQIAQALEISASAVANAKRRIYRKLDVASQCEVVARAAALGIIARPMSRRVVNDRPIGAVLLRGRRGPAWDRVTEVLLAADIAVIDGSLVDTRSAVDSRSHGVSFVLLVDPVGGDWPTGRQSTLPVALVCSTPPRRAEVLQALLSGAVTVLPVDRAETDLVPALTLAAHGYLTIEVDAASAMLDAVRAPSAAGLPQLTSREYDILHSIANGHTVRLTARALGIAEKTVENTQSRLFRKLGARNRPGALAAAHALGLLELVPSARQSSG